MFSCTWDQREKGRCLALKEHEGMAEHAGGFNPTRLVTHSSLRGPFPPLSALTQGMTKQQETVKTGEIRERMRTKHRSQALGEWVPALCVSKPVANHFTR